MANELHLRVVSPDRTVMDRKVKSVSFMGTDGSFGILPNHAGSDLAHRVFESQFRTKRGTMPLSFWGSIWCRAPACWRRLCRGRSTPGC